MPEITGFRALTYDPSQVDLSQVVTPPYDVIDAAQRARLVDRHPHNFVQVDLPEPRGGDGYRAAASTVARWLRDGILRRDAHDAVYRYHQVFKDPEHDRTLTRRGVVVAAALSPWSQGAIRPHEITFAAPREDRTRLLDATRVHLSPVFAMYDDAGAVDEVLGESRAAPDLAATTDDGTQHQVWRIDAPDTLAALAQRLRDRTAYVLDGHHRYETMVAFRDREIEIDRGGRPSAGGHGLMFLVPMTDPGLIILPTHRVVCGVRDLDRTRFLADVQRYCRVQPVPAAARDPDRLRDALRHAPAPAFAAVFPDTTDAYLLSFLDQRADGAPEITILHEVVLERVLGISPHARESHLRYVSNTQATLDRIARGDGQLALVVRPPGLAEIKRLADAGRVMPQKSTYFFPKLASGLVMLPVDG